MFVGIYLGLKWVLIISNADIMKSPETSLYESKVTRIETRTVKIFIDIGL